MFSSISDKLTSIFRNLRGIGKISEKNISDALEEIRRAFIDADVNVEVADVFIERVKKEAIGREVTKKVLPEHEIVKIVNDELVALFGGGKKEGENTEPAFSKKPLKILLAGLHGSGKTTTAGKLACFLKEQGYTPLLVACDIYRPAAIDQLQQIAEMNSVACHFDRSSKNVIKIAKAALKRIKDENFDAVIFDTAGRLHIDDDLIDEIKDLKKTIEPDEVYLVADAALGQESVNIAKSFNDAVFLTGIILTKLDGDTRGGAALSMNYVTGAPIKFVGTGEKSSDFSLFHPKRMATRILGMGDVVSLVEHAQKQVDKESQEKLANKIKKAEFDLDDFLGGIQRIKKMGPMSTLMRMLPGMSKMPEIDGDDDRLRMTEAIIQSMTKQEKRKPSIINSYRRVRIANGAGVAIKDVNALLKQFAQMQKMMKSFKGKNGAKNMQAMMAQFGLFPHS